MPAVAVIGSGVIGLSIAHELAVAGHDVTVFGDQAPEGRVSMLVAALWFPFEAYPADRVERWSSDAYRRFVVLAGEPGTGVRIASGRILVRDPAAYDDSWRAWVPGVREVDAGSLPDGVAAGYRVALPFIEMPVYLAWLERRCRQLGARIEQRHIPDVDAALAAADIAVIAGGLRSGELLGGDPAVAPVRGQVVRVANPGLTEWTLDEQHPGGLTYVMPRSADVVCGGTATRSDDLAVDAGIESAILERAVDVVPELAGAPVVSRAVGLRPGRTEVRLEHVRTDAAGAVIACYGHGGAGVTTSWGCAEEVAALVAQSLVE